MNEADGEQRSHETALYFPNMRVPRTAWFTQVLLYWDRAATIVPIGLGLEDEYTDPYMQELFHEGLLDYIRPEYFIGYRQDTFEEAFLHLISSHDAPPEERRSYTRVHVEKMTTELFREIESRGLAEEPKNPYHWWMVEKTTADMYMAYLAGCISASRERTVPVTDDLDTLHSLGPGSADAKARLDHLRYSTIRHALPAPCAPVRAAEIIEFKEQHAELLHRCRIYLDGKLVELTEMESSYAREIRSAAVLQEIRDDISTLTEQMGRRRWPRTALIGFGGVAAGSLATAAALASGGVALTVGLAVGAGVAAVGSSGYQTVDILRTPRYDARAPLAYAALAAQL